MAIHVQVGKFTLKSVLRCLEASLYICALCTRPYPATGVCGLLKSSFVIAAQGSFPHLNPLSFLAHNTYVMSDGACAL